MADENKGVETPEEKPGVETPPNTPEGDARKTVSWEEYQRIKADADRREAILKDYQAKEAERKAAEKEAEEKRLAEQGEFKTLLEQREAELTEAKSKLEQFQAAETKRNEALEAEFKSLYDKLSDDLKKQADLTEGLAWDKRIKLIKALTPAPADSPGNPTFPGGKIKPNATTPAEAAKKHRGIYDAMEAAISAL